MNEKSIGTVITVVLCVLFLVALIWTQDDCDRRARTLGAEKGKQPLACAAIESLIEKCRPTVLVSGRSPMGGIDIWTEEAAAKHGIPMDPKVPLQRRWEGPYGFKARNLDIANTSDVTACVVVAALPPGFKGWRSTSHGCYHCLDRNPDHVKSGGCWTAWRCKARE